MTSRRAENHAFRVVGIGEILWDLLPEGRVLGGATANFAFHAQALGADAAVVSRVGRDALGDEIIARVRDHGIDTSLLERDADHPTGTVSVTVDARGKPTYVIHEGVAWDFIAVTDEARRFVREADAVCFGSLAQRSPMSREAIRDLLGTAPERSLKIFDVNLRQSFYSKEVIEDSLALASLLKLSDEELPVIADLFDISGSDEACLKDLARRFSLRLVALTRGGEGSVLWTEGKTSTHAGFPAQVRDTVGAGDSFTATVAMGLLSGHALDRVNEQANRVASWVCAHDGAAPALPAEYAAWFATR